MTIGNRYLVKQEGKNTQFCKSYICTDLMTNKNVFIKVLSVSKNRKNVVNELFHREIKALEILQHPYIIEYLDSGTIDTGDPYIVVEYFPSQNLYEFVNGEVVNPEEKFNIAIRILDALIYSHDNNIIHRDLKPQNILIDIDHEIRIVDFGISKIIGLAYDPSETLKDYMSIRYAAPEQLQRLEVTLLSDLYSFGLLLSFLFTGVEPPENRMELEQYIGRIEFSGVARIIHELISTDLLARPQSGYKVKASLLKEKMTYISKTQKINFRCSPDAMRKLRNIGMIRNTNMKETMSFITSDIDFDDYYGYKKKEFYYFIGNRVKYGCKISKNRDFFNIVETHAIDDQLTYENELYKSEKLFIPWNFVDGSNILYHQEETEQMAYFLSDLEAQKSQINKEKLENKLVNNWLKLLQEEYRIIDEKRNICRYTDLKLDNTGNRIFITIKQCNYPIQGGENLQLSLSESNKQKTIGQFIKLIDESTVLASLNQDVDIDEFCTTGTLGIDIVQEKANLKRFSLALNQVKNNTAVNPKILDLINNPSNVSMNPVVPIDKFYQDVFQDQFSPNVMAVKKALSTKDFFLLQGPPGTGKTTVIAEIICQILHADKTAKILLTSQSHVAVDHAIKKVSELLPDICIVRIGRTERISKSSEKLLYANKLDEWVIETKEKSTNGLIDHLSKKYNGIEIAKIKEYLETYHLLDGVDPNLEQELNDQFTSPYLLKILSLIGRWQKHLGKLDEFDEIFANSASIVAATCVGIASRNKLSNLTYDWVIIDEAARATPLETLVPIVKGKKTIMIGDHKQLPPIFNSKVILSEAGLKKSDLEKSLFEDLIYQISGSARLVLTEQFRMHPAISEMINMAFYPDERITTALTPADRKHYLKWGDKAIIWLDTGSLIDNEENEVAFSKSNYCEVKVVTTLLQDIKSAYDNKSKCSIGVISGYDAQKNLLYDSIRPKNTTKWGNIDIAVDNIDAYQGSEVDIVIYSVVRSNKLGQLGFLNDIRRLNVALSRGKSCLIIVGNYKFIQKANLQDFNPFLPILQYIDSHKNFAVKEVLMNEQ